MHHKREILEKLTGVESSRKTYYKELNLVVDEMKKKNRQLEVMNRLTKIQVDADWTEVSLYLAEQLSRLIPFDQFILTLVERATMFSHIAQREQDDWHCRTVTRPLQQKTPVSTEQLNALLQTEHPDCHVTSVALQSRLQRVFGFLTLLHDTPVENDSEHLVLFQQIAEHVGVSVENMILFKDVSEKVKIEAQLVQSAKMAAIGEMAAGVAHELNSPLTAILGNIQLLMREIKTEPYSQMMNDIYQCGVRSKKIIQNLLTFSRQEEYPFERLNMNDLVEDVLGLIGYQLTVSGVTIAKKRSDKPLLFRGSRHQIEQIIINLLLNARDALQGVPSPTIAIETFQTFLPEGPFVGLSVHDNGVGIEKEHLPQIFHPFFTTKEQAKGTGLGLSVSLGIAESHDGKLMAQSEAGKFSCFTLLLPTTAHEENDGE
ncbi:sensor histidine kinase [Brevibacillus borstelensis]|uniref:sensor histidine kinase n=1 Tax=Brevibacillus borstelensis TaxID=45462 RepID=UPI003D243DB9